MNNNHQHHNFMWACAVLNLTPPSFANCSFLQATEVLDHFKKLAKSKFRKVILVKHVDKGGDNQITQDLIEANKIVKEALIQRPPPQPVVQYVRVMGYTYASSASGTTTGMSW